MACLMLHKLSLLLWVCSLPVESGMIFLAPWSSLGISKAVMALQEEDPGLSSALAADPAGAGAGAALLWPGSHVPMIPEATRGPQ